VKRVPSVSSYSVTRSSFLASLREETYFTTKRLLDLTVTFLMALLSAPVWLAAALAVRMTSPGPILYRQERVGARRVRRRGAAAWEPMRFTMYKFRSMRTDVTSDPHRAFTAAFIRGDSDEMARLNGGERLFKLVDDDRVTRVGAFLRRTSLDELPQLLNVLKGEMSLVGPRPAMPYEVEHYAPWHMRRFAAPAGVSGYWQVKGRSTVTFDEMVELDVAYIERRSLLLDLWILAVTPLAVLRRRGAA
jgi:lipopolysaccharide/colanic/teichoic acid biosynthesis glycosyltransferase